MDSKTLVLLAVAGLAVYFLTRPSVYSTPPAGASPVYGGASGYPLQNYRNSDAEIIAAAGQGLSGLITSLGNVWDKTS